VSSRCGCTPRWAAGTAQPWVGSWCVDRCGHRDLTG
jgi:hypothetical protein